MKASRRLVAGLLGAVLGVASLPLITGTAYAAPTSSLISGEIQQLTLNNPGDVWSGGWVRVGGRAVVLPRNLLLDLPANRLSLQQLFAGAPKACLDRQESGLAKSDSCNLTGTGGFATIQANRTNAGDVIAGDVFIEKGREILSGQVTSVNAEEGYFTVNGATMVRLNDPSARHSVQRGAGCAAGAENCSADPRFMLDPDNYTNAFSTGYPLCLPSTAPRIFVDKLDVNGNGNTTEQLTARAKADGTGDALCPDTNRNPSNVAADSRRFAPLQVGDHVSVKGNVEAVGGVQFVSAYSTKISTALTTRSGANQPDYMVLDEMFIDGPAFQRQRIRDLFIGATTEVDSDVVLYSVHRNPVNNAAHEFPLGTVLGCEAAAGPLTCRRVLGPNTFRVRHDTLLTTAGAKNTKLSACSHLNADPRFTNMGICPMGGTAAEEFGILSPLPHEVQARTGRKMADVARTDGGVLKTVDLTGRDATNGQFLFPMGMGLGGIEMPNFAEIDINRLGAPTSFDGIGWNLDRRLSPNGCVGPCESAPQPLDPFPFSGVDPRTQGNVPEVTYNDPNYTASPLSRTPNRILSYVDARLNNFNGDGTVLAWPPVDPPAQPAPPSAPPQTTTRGLITGLAPATGPEKTRVVIDGVGLTGASTVTFGGVRATTFTAVSDTQVSAVVPAGAITGPVAVTTPTGILTSAVRFTVVPPPTATRISPAAGVVGTTMTVTGTGFTTATDVTIGGAAASFTVLSDTALRATVPAGARTGPVAVTNTAGTATTPMDFSVTPPPAAPTVTGFAPSNGSPGTVVTITGTDLLTATFVTFGGAPSLSISTTNTTVTAIVPDGATTGWIGVGTTGGNARSAASFQVTPPAPPPAPPVVAGVAPPSGPAGTRLTITGSNFAGATSVTVGGKPAIFQQIAAGLLAIVPAGATTGAVVVTTALGGSGASPTPFIVTPAPQPDPTPTITSFTPGKAAVGATVVITGTNLAGAAGVSVNGTDARSFVVNSPTKITFVVGAGAGTGLIRVLAPNGIATSATTFTVTPPAPVPSISSFTPPFGNSGTRVVLTGKNFTGVTEVTVNGTRARSFVVNSPTKITLIVGSGTQTGLIRVTSPGGTATSPIRFRVVGKAR